MIAGVDDAGRGPVIGPLVIGGVAIDKQRASELARLGVRDSKLLSPLKRTRLAPKIRELSSQISLVEAQPEEIDEVVLHGEHLRKLNYLEAKLMAQVIAQLTPEEAYVDASDVNEARYGQTILDFLPNGLKAIKIVSEHHADRTYPVVSAASIIAKVRRDEAVAGLREEYGDFGSGYITDPKTMSFLRAWRSKHDEYPPIVRQSWKTIRELDEEFKQSRLNSYGSPI